MKKRIIIIIIIIVTIAFLAAVTRNIVILNEIEEKFSKVRNSTNYIQELHTYDNNEEKNPIGFISKKYYKDGVEKIEMQSVDGKMKNIQISEKNSRVAYVDSNGEKKTIKDNTEHEIDGTIYNNLESKSVLDSFYNALLLRIKTVEEDGSKYYKIEGLPKYIRDNGTDIKAVEIYINYDYGTVEKMIRKYNDPNLKEELITINYTFDTVLDEDFKLPIEDINQ